MRIAIIGAGIAGLTAALRLAQAGYSVVVYEAGQQAGGLASGFRDERWNWPLERFYHHIFQTDKAIIDLAHEMGFADKLFFRGQVTAQWWHGRGYDLNGPLQVLRFPALPFLDRLRLGLAVAYLKYGLRDWRPLEQETAAGWTRHRASRREPIAPSEPESLRGLLNLATSGGITCAFRPRTEEQAGRARDMTTICTRLLLSQRRQPHQ